MTTFLAGFATAVAALWLIIGLITIADGFQRWFRGAPWIS